MTCSRRWARGPARRDGRCAQRGNRQGQRIHLPNSTRGRTRRELTRTCLVTDTTVRSKNGVEDTSSGQGRILGGSKRGAAKAEAFAGARVVSVETIRLVKDADGSNMVEIN